MLAFYIVGVVLAYLMCKFIRNRAECNTWGDVGATMFVSIFSWFAIIIVFLEVIAIFCIEFVKLKNPPK